jgi:hypothetical protein
MATASVDDLVAADSGLTRSFVGCVVVWLASFCWAFFAVPTTPGNPAQVPWVPLFILVAQIGVYVWYAVSAGRAARVLGAVGWRYVVWILVAQFVALIPIPIVSMIIGVSPLSIKFLLGGQLQSAIRDATFADMHHVS